MVTTYLRRVYSSFVTHVVDIPPRLLSFLLLLLLIILPIVLSPTKKNALLFNILISANIIAIFSASWDLLVGRTGQISLGHGLFFGIGAYTTALLFKYIGWPLWITIPIGVVIATIAAVPIGFPALRVRGPYLALVTMALPLIAIGIVFYYRDITGGEHGIFGLPRFFPIEFFQEKGLSPSAALYWQRGAEYWLTLLLLFVSATILYKVANSRTGIVLVSILDDELASKACGINVTRYKLLSFSISACFASLAGGLMAHFLTIAGPSGTLSLTVSFLPVMLTVLGGIGTIYGPIIGTYIYYFLDAYILRFKLDVPHDWAPLVFFIAVVIFLVKWPRGIARYATEKLDDLAEEREIEERGPHIWKKYKRKKESTYEG